MKSCEVLDRNMYIKTKTEMVPFVRYMKSLQGSWWAGVLSKKFVAIMKQTIFQMDAFLKLSFLQPKVKEWMWT